MAFPVPGSVIRVIGLDLVDFILCVSDNGRNSKLWVPRAELYFLQIYQLQSSFQFLD